MLCYSQPTTNNCTAPILSKLGLIQPNPQDPIDTPIELKTVKRVTYIYERNGPMCHITLGGDFFQNKTEKGKRKKP